MFCRRSSTFVNNKFDGCHLNSATRMSETFFDTCVNWSCVTRCGCRTTSSTLFTVSGRACIIIAQLCAELLFRDLLWRSGHIVQVHFVWDILSMGRKIAKVLLLRYIRVRFIMPSAVLQYRISKTLE